MPTSRLDATSSIRGGKALSERVALRRTRVRLVTLEQVVVAGLFAALIGLFSAGSGGPKAESPGASGCRQPVGRRSGGLFARWAGVCCERRQQLDSALGHRAGWSAEIDEAGAFA